MQSQPEPRKDPRRLDEDGKVATAPRNFYTGPVKKGKTDSVYFSKPTYTSIGDPFKMVAMEAMRSVKPKVDGKPGWEQTGHERDWKKAVTQERLYRATYEHIDE